MKKSIFIAIIAILILMAAATSCVTVNIIPNGNIIPNENKISNENINQAENNGKVEQYYGYIELHDPVAWDSSCYVPHSVDDSLVKIDFTWSTGVKQPRLFTEDSGKYEFTYTEVYASGAVSTIKQLFVADSGVVIDPVVKVYYFWLSVDATPNVDVKEPYYLKPFKTIEVYASETPWYEIILRRQGLM